MTGVGSTNPAGERKTATGGRLTCTNCRGLGSATCSRCQGAGIVGGMTLRRHASTGQPKLTTYHPCPSCSGAGGARGQITCAACGGAGRV